MTDMLPFLKEYGVPTALVLLFIYWSWVREKRLNEKLDEVQKERITELVSVVKSNTEAFMMLKATLEKWNNRPCLVDEKK
jgi:hypothetical protein